MNINITSPGSLSIGENVGTSNNEPRQTSTPFNDNLISTTLNKPQIPNFPSPNSQNTSINNSNRNLNHHLLITKASQIDEIVKVKEKYLNNLKSIDLQKYSFENENRPRTDYTYAKTGSYLSSRASILNENYQVPNLCRRSKRSLSQLSANNSLLDESSNNNDSGVQTTTTTTTTNSNSNILNRFKLLLNVNQLSPFKNKSSIKLNNLNGLDRNDVDDDDDDNRHQHQQRETLDTSINVRKRIITNNNTINSNSDRREAPVEPPKDGIIVNLFRFLFKLIKWLLIICLFSGILLFLSQSLINGNWYKNIKLFNNTLIETNYNYNQEYNLKIFEQEMLNLKSKFINEIIDKLHLNKLNNELDDIRQDIDNKYNKSLTTFLNKLHDISFIVKEEDKLTKETCKQEINKLKEIIKSIDDKYINLINKEEEQQQQEVEETIKSKVNENNEQDETQTAYKMINDKLEELVKKHLYIYNADRTGMADYASESLGGSILFTRCTEIYTDRSPYFTIWNIRLYRITQSPRVVIQNDVKPGNCWAFKGDKADLFIKLSTKIKPTSVSIEHISKELSPSGTLLTAPQNFTVYGYNNMKQVDDNDGFLLGSYRYDNNSDSTIQFFKIQNEPEYPIHIVELKIESNAGDKDYTCLYKFRVHGTTMMN